MSGGSPDYTKTTKMMANFGGNLVPVAVDADGQLYALLKGYDGATYVPLSVDSDGHIVAVMTGSDGVNLETVLLDSTGRMITVLQDPATGNVVGIDADGYLTSVMKGLDGATLRTFAVDAGGRLIGVFRDPTNDNYLKIDGDGFLTAVLKGLDGVTLRTIKVDGSGRMVGTIVDGTTGVSVTVDANGFLSSVMKGLDGATLRTVAVDASGYMIGLFKGSYSGTLKTLATDTDGRLMAIMTDPENFRGVRAVVGGAEIVARLGSAVSFERRGTVFYLNDVSTGESMGKLTESGAGAIAFVTADHSRTSGFAYALSSGTAGSSYAQFDDRISLSTYTGNIGLEFHITFLDVQIISAVGITVYDGVTALVFGLKWDMNTGKLYYRNNVNAWVDSGDSLSPYAHDWEFIPIKLVVDLDTGYYRRLYIGSELHDWSAFEAYSVASGIAKSLSFAVSCEENGAATVKTLYLCDLILTVSEEDT